MIGLWAVFAVLLLLAVCFIIWPLLPFSRKKQFATIGQQQENIDIFHDRLHELEQEKAQGNLDQEAFLKLKTELEKNLLQDTHTQGEDSMLTPVMISGKHWMFALSLVTAVTIVSLGMYLNLGRSDDLFIRQAMADEIKSMQAGGVQPPSMEKSIELLEAKLAKDPNNKEKQYLLVNSYAAVGKFDKAAKLYGKLAESAEPGSEEFARLKGVQAQSLFQASGESMTPAIQSLIDEALKADAEEPSSLMLQGINSYNSSNYKQAIAFWEKAKGKAGEDQITRFIDPAIKSSQQKMGIATAPKSAVKPNQKVAGGASLIIDLTLNKALKEKVNDDDIVFVFARPVGGRMPLAAERIKVKDLPTRIVLDDTKAAMPTAKLSSVDVVEVTARVSKSGQPMAQKGDLFAEVKNIAVSGSVSIALDINQIVE